MQTIDDFFNQKNFQTFINCSPEVFVRLHIDTRSAVMYLKSVDKRLYCPACALTMIKPRGSLVKRFASSVTPTTPSSKTSAKPKDQDSWWAKQKRWDKVPLAPPPSRNSLATRTRLKAEARDARLRSLIGLYHAAKDFPKDQTIEEYVDTEILSSHINNYPEPVNLEQILTEATNEASKLGQLLPESTNQEQRKSYLSLVMTSAKNTLEYPKDQGQTPQRSRLMSPTAKQRLTYAFGHGNTSAENPKSLSRAQQIIDALYGTHNTDRAGLETVRDSQKEFEDFGNLNTEGSESATK